MARSTLLAVLFPLFVAAALPLAANAQDEDLDDLPDDFLQDGGDVKVRDTAPATDGEEESFDFGDDPDWDAAPDPVPVPAGLDEDPGGGAGPGCGGTTTLYTGAPSSSMKHPAGCACAQFGWDGTSVGRDPLRDHSNGVARGALHTGVRRAVGRRRPPGSEQCSPPARIGRPRRHLRKGRAPRS